MASSDAFDRLVGVAFLDELIDIHHADFEGKIIKFANYLRTVLRHLPSSSHTDMLLLAKTAAAVGHIARSSGSLASDFVEFEVQRALEWISSERYLSAQEREHKRMAAALILHQLALNVPPLFMAHIPIFLENMWELLQDSKMTLREAAADAFGACLSIMSTRIARWRAHWYSRIFDDCKLLLFGPESVGETIILNFFVAETTPKVSIETIHACFLVLRELCLKAADFIAPKFTEVCDIVFLFRTHKSQIIRDMIFPFIPILAKFNVEIFASNYLNSMMKFLLVSIEGFVAIDMKSGGSGKVSAKLKGRQKGRDIAFSALGHLCSVIGSRCIPFFDQIFSLIKVGLSSVSSKVTQGEVLTCLSLIVKTVGNEARSHVSDMLNLIFRLDLSVQVVDCLEVFCSSFPDSKEMIQNHVLTMITHTLEVFDDRPSDMRSSGDNSTKAYERCLALRSLRDLQIEPARIPVVLFPVLQKYIVNYLEHMNPEIRKEAVLTTCRLVSLNIIALSQERIAHFPGISSQIRVFKSELSNMLLRVLTVGLSDSDPSIRVAVLRSLDSQFDPFMCTAKFVSHIFSALNDELLYIRELALLIIARLSHRNPAYVLPALRKFLIQIIMEITNPWDRLKREENAKLLGILVERVEPLVHPYVSPIFKILLPQLLEEDVSPFVLSALGCLSNVSNGGGLLGHLDTLFPIIIKMLGEDYKGLMISSKLFGASRKEVALRTLGQLVQSSGSVIQPFVTYPTLLTSLVGILLKSQSETDLPWSVRREAMRVFGIIGAIDPLRLPSTTQLPIPKEDKSREKMSPLKSSSPEYYPTIAMNHLLKLLNSPLLVQLHGSIIQAMMLILRGLGLSCIPFLPRIIPQFLSAIRMCEDSLQDLLLQQLGHLISIVKEHIRNFLNPIMDLINDHWNSSPAILFHMVSIISELAKALHEEFKPHLSVVLPRLSYILEKVQTETHLCSHVLRCFTVLVPILKERIFMIISSAVGFLPVLC
jgi:FKBP12-rapamycin complex-associated protein